MNVFELINTNPGTLIKGITAYTPTGYGRFSDRNISLCVGGWNSDHTAEIKLTQVVIDWWRDEVVEEAGFSTTNKILNIQNGMWLTQLPENIYKHFKVEQTNALVLESLKTTLSIRTIKLDEPVGLYTGRHIVCLSEKKLQILAQFLTDKTLGWLLLEGTPSYLYRPLSIS